MLLLTLKAFSYFTKKIWKLCIYSYKNDFIDLNYDASPIAKSDHEFSNNIVDDYVPIYLFVLTKLAKRANAFENLYFTLISSYRQK